MGSAICLQEGEQRLERLFRPVDSKNDERRKTENSDTCYDDVCVSTTSRRTDSRLCNFGTAQLESPRSVRLRCDEYSSVRLRCDECSSASILRKSEKVQPVWIRMKQLKVTGQPCGCFGQEHHFLAASIHILHSALLPHANCNILLHRLVKFDFACKAVMGSGKNQMSIDRASSICIVLLTHL